MDRDAFDSLQRISEREQRTPQEMVSQLFGQVAKEQAVQSDALLCWEQLSPRQKQVAAHICNGDTTRQIAAVLHISQTTVKTHAKAILAKFGVNNRETLRVILSPWDLGEYL